MPSYTELEQKKIDAALRIVTRHLTTRDTVLTSPEKAKDLARLHVSHLEHEMFCCMWLDTKHHLIEFEPMFRGTIDGASVYSREVAKSALAHNAAAVILVHNHPSGISEASSADRIITTRLKNTLNLIDVRVLDHLVVGRDIYSFAENGAC